MYNFPHRDWKIILRQNFVVNSLIIHTLPTYSFISLFYFYIVDLWIVLFTQMHSYLQRKVRVIHFLISKMTVVTEILNFVYH